MVYIYIQNENNVVYLWKENGCFSIATNNGVNNDTAGRDHTPIPTKNCSLLLKFIIY